MKTTPATKMQRKNERGKEISHCLTPPPPYSKNVGTNIGKKFFKLLDTCFPPENKLHQILIRNTIKISYSCVRNIKQIITNHNKEIVRENEAKDTEKVTTPPKTSSKTYMKVSTKD